MARTELTLSFEWIHLGDVHLDEGGRLAFPKASLRPGLYRFEFHGPQGRSIYIGETDQLDRRFQHYRTPGPSQRTNIRINALMREVLKAGGKISVATMTDGANLRMSGQERSADLLQKSERVLLEHAALYEVRLSDTPIVNA